jgi:hypothetical protein
MLDSTAPRAAAESARSDFPHGLHEFCAIRFKAEGNAPSLSGRSVDELCPNRVRLPDPI